jgi:hypothetical protein
MKLGVALDGSGRNHSQTGFVLSQLREIGAVPQAYAISAGQTMTLLEDLFHSSFHTVVSAMRRASVCTLEDLSCPISVCARDLLHNRDVTFGPPQMGFSSGPPLSFWIGLSKSRSIRFYRRNLLSVHFIHTNSLLQALNKMECDRYLVIGESINPREDTARCLYLDYPACSSDDLKQKIRRDFDRICHFLYFS